MQLVKVNRDHVLKPLKIVRGIVENRHTQPIMANVLIEKNGSEVSFLASDLEMQVSTKSNLSDTEDKVATTVSARKLFDFLNSLDPASEVSLSLEEQHLLIEAGRGKFTLQTLNAVDYPKMRVPEKWDLQVSITQAQLKKLCSMTYFAMAHDDVRYFLNGMLFVFADQMLHTVSTDGHRLAHAAIKLDKAYEAREKVVPRKTIIELQKLLDDSDEPVLISLSDIQMRFEFGDVDLVSRLVDGKYPDYNRVIPNPHEARMVINRSVLQSAFQRVCILSDDKIKGVKCHFYKNTLRISSVNKNQEQATEEIEVDYSFDPLELAFNASYLLDVLSMASRSEEIIWYVNPNQPLAASLIMLPEDDQFKYVVMPMRI